MKNYYGYLVKTAWKFATPYQPRMLGYYLMFVFANLVSMSEPYVLALMLNTIQVGGDNLLIKVMGYLGLFVGIEFFFWVFHGNGRVLERITAFHIIKNYYDRLFFILSKLPLKWHKNHHSGEIASRVKKAAEAIYQFSDDSYEFIETIVRFIVSLVAIFILLPKFGVLALLMGVGIVIVIFRFDKLLVKDWREINERSHAADSTFFDYITNIGTVITLRLEKLAQNVFTNKVLRIFPVLRRNIIINEIKWFAISLGLVLMNALILFFYIYEQLSASKVILIGTLMALYQYSDRFVQVFFRLAWQYEKLVRLYTDVKTTEKIFSAYDEVSKVQDFSLSKTSLRGWGNIGINQLSFRHDDETDGIHHLDKINLELKRGVKIALVGESGSGKSTLMTLIRGLHDADHVEVNIDGKIFPSLRVLANSVTLIPQEPEIFENTIEYNVTAGIPHKKEDVGLVCDWARFDSVVQKLPRGLKTNIKEKGVNLSGGEKQRLALARGLFAARSAKSTILLLDEPTSSVDPKNEMMIYKAIFREFDQLCLVASVHRLHLLGWFDLIYLFDQGKIVGQGSFYDLLSRNDLFKTMWEQYQREDHN
ncbi:MAG: ABC transporter [Candidatus Peregrinibacteria bacterium GW2011_GWE2_39_6]|nr:MAG: ABC transporter [Candidatus Peregrinibacteria bacterium GW2011_GWF2_39_17]KKR25595.1 MAG: ABC transporter [Candidatus Peregrinibacteria bacterium GW2011_GWE2_39_6]HCW31977.1 ABC transporter ATP-binding protein [Candidatus Peregrinibacteria bacterium]